MGCVQSRQKAFKNASSANEEAAAARLLAHQQVIAAQKAATAHRVNISGPSPLPPRPPPPRLPETEVMKRATAFDKLHEDAHKAPALQDVKVVMGKQSQKLLEGFEQKEAAARAKPKLNNVKSTDLRTSRLFDKLQQYEEKDAQVRREPKLEKTFSQREKEKLESKQDELLALPQAAQSMSEMTAVPRPVPSI